MKVAVIGAGSTYTPELVSGLPRARRSTSWCCTTSTPSGCEIVGGARRGGCSPAPASPARWSMTADLDRALEGADFVLIQIRVGGQAARLRDETFPLACGCIGQETTGAGGFAKALRTVPVVLEIAERVRELAARDAWIVDFTNPVGIVTRALLDAGHRAVGLCNVAIGFQRALARMLGVEPDAVAVDQVGLNHLTWVRAVGSTARDVLPDVLAEHGDELAERSSCPAAARRARRRSRPTTCATSTRTTRCSPSSAAARRRARPRWPRSSASCSRSTATRTLDREARAARAARRRVLQRGGDGLVASLVGRRRRRPRRRRRATAARWPGSPADDVVEVPARVDARRAAPLAAGAARARAARPRAARRRLRAARRAQAARQRDRVDARKALLAHPLIGQWRPVDDAARARWPAGGGAT